MYCVVFVASSLPAWTQQDQQPTPKRETQDARPSSSERASQMSSSKDTRIDLSPPKDDTKDHPQSRAAIVDEGDDASDIQEFHPWDPHKAAKDIEVGNFYYKRKNYHAALERYQEALTYKPNDAIANFRLAECEEKTGDASNALVHYQQYLKLLPHGPLAGEAEKAIAHLNATTAKQNSAN
jgi:tetratricopeptide (TPR) repeat protein